LDSSEVEWCGDDSRAELHYEDAIAWFKNRFSEDRIDSEEYDEEPFDVMIMDALDPQDNVPFAKILYTDEVFVESLYDALSDDGVMVFQLGGAPYALDPPDEHTWSARRKDLIKLLEDVGFVDLRTYEDANCGFSDAWVFLIASKSKKSRSQWFMSAADLEVEKHWRLLRTNNGIPTLQYFDSGVMSNYRYPHKAFESIYCASSPTPKSCLSNNVFQDRQPDVPLSDFEVRMSSVGDGSGRGVFTKVDIKKGSTIARRTFRYPVLFPHFATGHLYNYYTKSKTFQDLFSYVDGYGYQSLLRGEDTYLVDSSILTFINHGCNGTYNVDIGTSSSVTKDYYITEQNASIQDREDQKGETYDPVTDRRDGGGWAVIDIALRDIAAGEEILCNYVFFTEDSAWLKELNTLKKICNGEEIGLIVKSEMEHMRQNEEKSINTSASNAKGEEL